MTACLKMLDRSWHADAPPFGGTVARLTRPAASASPRNCGSGGVKSPLAMAPSAVWRGLGPSL